MAQRLKQVKSVTVSLAPAFQGKDFNNLECEPDRRIKPRDNAAFGIEPQEKG
jgi:hypothetical protein